MGDKHSNRFQFKFKLCLSVFFNSLLCGKRNNREIDFTVIGNRKINSHCEKLKTTE